MTNCVHILSEPACEVFGLDVAVFSAVIAIGTLITAGLSVWISVRTARGQKQIVDHQIVHDKKTVMPILCVERIVGASSRDEPLGYFLCNYGLGPALTASPLILIDGKPVCLLQALTGDQFLSKFQKFGAPKGMIYFWKSAMEHSPVREGARDPIIISSGEGGRLEGKAWLDLMERRLQVIVPYTSIYKDKIHFAFYGDIENGSMYPKNVLKQVWPELVND